MVGEEDEGESFSSPSPSATTKSPPSTKPESSSLQVQRSQLMSTLFKRPHSVNAPSYRKVISSYYLSDTELFRNEEITCVSRLLMLNVFFQTAV